MFYHTYILLKHVLSPALPYPKMRQHGDCSTSHYCPTDGKLCAMHPYINLCNAVNYFCHRCARVCQGD
ncbi:uncharacterized protein CcaverHIS019_0309860 [Cutaneotrichosporon cavernicola]|uniref:Uncharacterized protein n=1 Tax=Cutaneotrichosporon cavernicola TaxID=279322 RepID=A0AA48IFZ2_9TREE|nr:uncharacterized protein CcaverHIS019_0309860 [Cutaneotrichosporon cavernicola]BEI90916.1 hypothetical protein CcaverHIS019_0309860 [Cutaneotrichosporon cavernicola]